MLPRRLTGLSRIVIINAEMNYMSLYTPCGPSKKDRRRFFPVDRVSFEADLHMEILLQAGLI